MYRATLPYGRKGIALQAISAIDIALWDVCGKASDSAVYELLGGPVHPDVPVNASALHPVGAELVAQEAKAYVAEGYQAMKARFPYGPGSGVRGMAENEAHVANIRDAVGPDIEIMIDAYMGWDFNYAKKMCRRLEPYDLAWIEEPFVPDDLTSYAKLRRETNIPISGGEHEYTRYGFADIIEREAMDILQPDLRRCGGFTEGQKIAALAQGAGLTVIPHAYGVAHIHYALGTANVPMVEYFPMPVWDSMPESDRVPIFIGEPQPAGGRVSAESRPGLGVEINEAIFGGTRAAGSSRCRGLRGVKRSRAGAMAGWAARARCRRASRTRRDRAPRSTPARSSPRSARASRRRDASGGASPWIPPPGR